MASPFSFNAVAVCPDIFFPDLTDTASYFAYWNDSLFRPQISRSKVSNQYYSETSTDIA